MIDIKTQFSGLVTIMMVCVAILSVQLVALFKKYNSCTLKITLQWQNSQNVSTS